MTLTAPTHGLSPAVPLHAVFMSACQHEQGVHSYASKA